MAGGPVWPYSDDPGTSGCIYPGVYVGSASRNEWGMLVKASLAADAVRTQRYMLPPTLPSGTMTLNVVARANAVTGCAVVSPSWGMCALTEDSELTSLTCEGDTAVVWSAGGSDVYNHTQITMDADTPVASEIVVMRFGYLGSSGSWPLAAVSLWQTYITWE